MAGLGGRARRRDADGLPVPGRTTVERRVRRCHVGRPGGLRREPPRPAGVPRSLHTVSLLLVHPGDKHSSNRNTCGLCGWRPLSQFHRCGALGTEGWDGPVDERADPWMVGRPPDPSPGEPPVVHRFGSSCPQAPDGRSTELSPVVGGNRGVSRTLGDRICTVGCPRYAPDNTGSARRRRLGERWVTSPGRGSTRSGRAPCDERRAP